MAKAKSVHSTPRRSASKTQTKKKRALLLPARPTEDPVFAAIENHRQLDEGRWDIQGMLDEADKVAEKKHGNRPSESVPWRAYSVSAANLEATRAEVLKLPGVDPTKIQTEYWDLRARLLGAKPGGKEWDMNAGLAGLRRDLDRALSAEGRASWKLAWTKPTTPAGAGALLDYVKTMMFEIGDMHWHKHALDTIRAHWPPWRRQRRVCRPQRLRCSRLLGPRWFDANPQGARRPDQPRHHQARRRKSAGFA